MIHSTFDSLLGSVVLGCGNGKQYLFTNKEVSSYDSYKGCCKYGFQTATINSSEEMACVLDQFQKTGRSSGKYWGPFLDVDVDRSFASCVIEGAIFKKELTFPGELDNSDGKELCILYLFTKSKIGGYVDGECTQTIAFNFCEAPYPFLGSPKRTFKTLKSKIKKKS